MSVARCLEINARLRAAGITVHEWPDWQSAGNGQSSAYEGGLDHHTATDYGMALPGTGIGMLLRHGRSNLAGPLCNYATNEDGSMTLIAAHPANHAGASGGRSMGPLPTTTLFNKRVLGNEIVYPGFMPMRDAQYHSALVWSRIVTDVCGYGDIERARAHAETSITGKWDPGDAPGRTINMAAFRAAAAIVGGQQGDDMSFSEQISGFGTTATAGVWLIYANHYATEAHKVALQNKAMLATVIANQQDDLDTAAVLAQLDMSVREALNATVLPAIQRIEEALSRDDASEAKAIVTELAERLRPAA